MCNIGIADEKRVLVTHHLQNILADEYVLLTKTLKYHWNVRGELFGPLHLLFEKQYNDTFLVVDQVAERIRMLGESTQATLEEFLGLTRLTEMPGAVPDAGSMIADLLDDHEVIIQHLREDIVKIEQAGDAGTVDFLTQLLQQHEKTAWFLRAHLESVEDEEGEEGSGCCGCSHA